MLKPFWRSRKPDGPILSGPNLVSDFQSAMTNLTTAATANLSAEQSEQVTLQTIESANPQYVTSKDIDPGVQDQLVRSSMNAHLQKVQAEQITNLTEQQVIQMETEDKQNYKGKKVVVKVLDTALKPIDSYWLNEKTGEERSGTLKTKAVRGTIENISFHKNQLILKPTIKSRLILPDRKFLMVYVINPETLAPSVEITLI